MSVSKRLSSRSAMTLVELLVALVILAAVATGVAVSSANLLDRSRVEKTVRQGEEIASALERHDGLSLVSDLGPLFDFTGADQSARNARNLARLNYLFSDSAPYEVETADGEIVSLSTVVKKAPRYRALTTHLVPTNFAALAGRDVTGAQLAALTNSLPHVSLGCGWRGPYCEEKSALDGDGVLRDGFGGLWECDVNATNGVLVSRGQDRAADGLEEKEWRDRDIVFTIRNGVSDISLDVSVDDGMLADGEMISRLHVFVFAPVFTISETTDDETTISLGVRHFTSAGSSVQITSGLSYGSRVVFVIAEAVDTGTGDFIRYYATDPRRTVLKPGVNQLLDLKLVTKSDM